MKKLIYVLSATTLAFPSPIVKAVSDESIKIETKATVNEEENLQLNQEEPEQQNQEASEETAPIEEEVQDEPQPKEEVTPDEETLDNTETKEEVDKIEDEVNDQETEHIEIETEEDQVKEVEPKNESLNEELKSDEQDEESESQEKMTLFKTQAAAPNSADEWYTFASSQTTASGLLEAYIDAYNAYPNDSRFVKGVQESALNLLNWTRGKHNQKDFALAIDRYQAILNAPALSSAFRASVDKHLKFANEKKLVPTANDLYHAAKQQAYVSSIFTSFVEAYGWYPYDPRFQLGLQESAESLFNWAKNKHNQGQYEIAADRYELILSVSGINEKLKSEVEKYLKLAEKGTQSADSLFALAQKETSASGKLDLFLKGYESYPEDTRFLDGIQSSAEGLLSWARGQHNKGNYATAIDRYTRIIQTPSIKETIREITEKHLAYAEAKKAVPTADSLYKKATSLTTVSGIFESYVEGFSWYPEDARFQKGLQSSAQSLFDWAKAKHDQGEYEKAIVRYDMILAESAISSSLKNDVEARLADAKISKRSADIIYQAAVKDTTASGKLNLYLEGYKFYPNDSRFVKGLNSSVDNLYSWTISKHNQGQYDIAEGRYALLLTVPTLSNSLKEKISIQLPFAKENKKVPNAEGFYALAMSESTASGQLARLVDGYTLYPGNNLLVEAINTSARSLLEWASTKHEAGDFQTAKDRYEVILATPGITEFIKKEATLKLELANQNKTFQTADDLYNKAISETSASKLLEAFIIGYTFYPQDSRFKEGINSSAEALLNWTIKQHENGQYSTAVDRYERILAAPEVNELIRYEAEVRRSYAVKEQKAISADQLYSQAVSDTTASGKLDLFVKGYILYPEDERFLIGVNSSALSLLEWARNKHESRDFNTAIQRYNVILSSPGISDSLKNITQRLLDSAVANELPKGEYITKKTYDVSLDEAISIQANLDIPPQTDKYRNAPAYVHSSFLSSVTWATTSTSNNLRKTPSLKGEISVNVGKGVAFEFLGTVTGETWNGSNIWYKIKYKNEILYIHGNLASGTGNVSQSTNVYESTSSKAHIFSTSKKGSELKILDKLSGSSWNGSSVWYEVSLGDWRNAKQSDYAPYIDPSNNDIFQHLVLTSSAGVSASQLNKLLAGKGTLDGTGELFIEAGLMHSVNEIYLLSHALLETGHGTSPLSKGIEVGENSKGEPEVVTASNKSKLTNIKTTYNMFGIGAVDSDPDRKGAIRAYKEKWYTPKAAILGGAKFIGEGYIHNKYNQNTLYKMRWNPANPGYPQYATDMGWAVKQLPNIKSLYEQLEDPILHFDVVSYK